MCGISGLVAYEGITEQDSEAVANMVRQQRHRGPDAQAVQMFDTCALGHNRLAILDVSARSNQPMCSHDGTYTIVFNGEIYNHPELRRELEQQGIVFRTNSDTEVLLEYFALHGVACFRRFNGMFALAIWDNCQRRLVLARDRFGQKPLYYTSTEGTFVFASEVASLFCHPKIERRPNFQALYQYLTLQSVPAPLCAFENVHKLPPAHWLALSPQQQPIVQSYWNISEYLPFTGSDHEAEEELDALVSDAVRRHLVSDVPVGVLLSGGVDSSLVAAHCPQNMRAFCVRGSESGFDESPFAAQVADHCGVSLLTASAEVNMTDVLPRMVHHYGEPFADSSALPAWLLCSMAQQHVTVALSGDGGDDIFNGYARHVYPFQLASTPVPPSAQDKTAELQRCCSHALGKRTLSPMLASYIFHLSTFCGEGLQRLCLPELKAACVPTELRMLDDLDGSSPEQLLDSIRRLELNAYLASTLLPKMDIAAMAYSLEVRMPLLDMAVTDFAFSLPSHMRVRTVRGVSSFGHSWEAKWLLKQVACRHLPEDIVFRRKHGFSVPLGVWLRQPLAAMTRDILQSPHSFIRQMLDMREVARIIDAHMQGTANHQHRIWSLLMLEFWAQAFLR